MRNRVMLGLLAVAGWLFPIVGAHAVSLGKIDVASHLGEPFFAEVPLMLDAGENVSSIFVELASPADYRILEVYRDPALNVIRADVESDSRGVRVELSSRNVLEAPFLNLVLKVRYDRATHFKKFPIFLDLPKAIKPVLRKPLPTVSAVAPAAGVEEAGAAVTAPAVAEVEPIETTAKETKPAFTPYSGWSRTSRYGPMVYGDTVSTVAERLRTDDRYTRNQVMVALFEKNRRKFDQDNINLIKAGTYLDVPAAAEVERISVQQANSVIAEHEKRWKELVKQPRYAAVAEAQRTRYSKRVRVGKAANGVAATPIPSEKAQEKDATATVSEEKPEVEVSEGAADGKASEAFKALQQQNEELQAKLAESEQKIATLSAKTADADAAAANARIKKLELQLARLQSELDEAKEDVASAGAGSNWLTYALAVVIVLLLGLVGFLMRKERPHPAAVAAGAARPPVEEAPTEEQPVEEVEEVEVEEAAAEAPESTMQMDTGEMEDAFTDSVPELTESDTAEMEAFSEAVEEEPDANVDYMAEADVYLRYGMDDEALQQVKMALRLQPDNADAHIKLVQILYASGDSAGVDAAATEAAAVLAGEDLDRFTQAVDALGQEGAGAAEGQLEDTLPPTLDVAAAEEGAAEVETVADMDVGGETETLAETLDISDIELPEEEAAAAEAPEPAESSVEVETTVDMPVTEGEEEALAEEVSEPEEIAAPEVEPAEEAAAEPAAEEEEQVEVITEDTGGLDFDLSDIELPGEEVAGQGGEQGEAQLKTADLEKTVLMDWSRETAVDSGEMDIEGESGAEEPAVEAEAEAPVADEEAAAAEETAEEVTAAGPDMLDLDASDLGQDLPEAPDESEEAGESADDFTSTIQTTLTDIKLDKEQEADFTATGEHDLQTGSEPAESEARETPPADASPSLEQEQSGEEEIALDFDLDDEALDATQQLDSLLSEISDESEKEDK